MEAKKNKMEIDELERKIEELKGEVDLEWWKERLERSLSEPVVELKLYSGKVMHIPQKKIVKMSIAENEVIRTMEGEHVAWVAEAFYAELAIHLSGAFNYHLGYDGDFKTLVVTRKE